MPSEFVDGPAAGKVFDTRLAPTFLRVVIDTSTEKWDVLDQPDDEPREREVVYAYRSEPGSWGQVFACGRGQSAASGEYQSARYTYIEPQPDQATLRDTAAWRKWVDERVAREQG